MTRTLLVLDYPGRRAEGRVSDLGLGHDGYELIDLLRTPLPDEVTGREYTGKLAHQHALEDREVAAVLAYCAAAPLAQELAQHLVEAGHPPPLLIFFNAVPSAADSVRDDYTTILKQLGASLPSTPVTGLDLAQLLPSPIDLIHAMSGELDAVVRASLVDDLYDEEEVTEATAQIVAVYLDLLRYQIAAYHSTAPAWGGDAVNIVSAGHSFQDDWVGACSTRLVRVECSPTELLSRPETRDGVLAYLPSPNPTTTERCAP